MSWRFKSSGGGWRNFDADVSCLIEFKFMFCAAGQGVIVHDRHFPSPVIVYPKDGYAYSAGVRYQVKRTAP